MEIKYYEMTDRDIEDVADSVKTSILQALVVEKILDEATAEDWAKEHTVIIRKKSFFRTISKLWRDEEKSTHGYYLVVKKVLDDST